MTSEITSRASMIDSCQPRRGSADGEYSLEQVLDNAAHLTAHGREVAPAQALHLLGQVFQVERGIYARRRHPAQLRRLRLGPGVVIRLIERSFEHLGHRFRFSHVERHLDQLTAPAPAGAKTLTR
jgi:hypothetical protein